MTDGRARRTAEIRDVMKGRTHSIDEIRALIHDRRFMATLRRLLRQLEPITDRLRRIPSELEREAAAIVLMFAIDEEAGGIRLFESGEEFYIG